MSCYRHQYNLKKAVATPNSTLITTGFSIHAMEAGSIELRSTMNNQHILIHFELPNFMFRISFHSREARADAENCEGGNCLDA